MRRRQVAPLIRSRQECWKRIERVLPVPTWRGAADSLAVLDGRLARSISGRTSDPMRAIAEWLRHDSAARYPREHLTSRDRSALPDADAVVTDAERLARGDWDVFGRPVHVEAATVDWRAHPLSAIRTPLRHFSRVSCAPDALGGDVKFLWEVNRHAELVRLAQAYWLSRRPEFARVAVDLLESWMDQNPPGMGVNWVSCLDVSFRAIAWCWLWQLTSDSDAWTDARIGRLLWCVARAGGFIARYDSVHHSPNTHLTGEALGLVYIGSVFPGLRDSARWRELGVRILREEAPRQFLADGMHYERCTGYHRYHMEFYLHALAIARASGEAWAEPFEPHLSRGADVSLHLRRPDGTWPVLGDEDGGATVRLGTRDVTDQSELLAAAASLLGRPELRTGVATEATALSWWMLDAQAWRALECMRDGDAPMTASASFPVTGYHVARDDWSEQAWYCVVDAGPHGGDATGHAHTDVGHVEIARGGEHVVVDAGCPVYTGDLARRDWFRGQHGHAGVTIDGVELAVPGSAFQWKTVAPTPDAESRDEGAHWWCRLWYSYATPSGAVSHERHVVLVRGQGVMVVDLLDGTGSRAVTVRWPLQRIPDVSERNPGRSALALGRSRINWCAAAAHVRAAVEPTQRSPEFGVAVDAGALLLSLPAAELPCAIVTTFTASTDPEPEIHASGDEVAVELRAADDRVRPRFVFRRGAAARRS